MDRVWEMFIRELENGRGRHGIQVVVGELELSSVQGDYQGTELGCRGLRMRLKDWNALLLITRRVENNANPLLQTHKHLFTPHPACIRVHSIHRHCTRSPYFSAGIYASKRNNCVKPRNHEATEGYVRSTQNRRSTGAIRVTEDNITAFCFRGCFANDSILSVCFHLEV